MRKVLMPAVLANEQFDDPDGLIFAANDRIGAVYVADGIQAFRNSKPTASGSVVQILSWCGADVTWIALRTKSGWHVHAYQGGRWYINSEFWHYVTNHVTIIDGEDLK